MSAEQAGRSGAPSLRELLDDGRVHVMDGAMGTMLYSRGAFVNLCYEELNVTRPDLVRSVHEAYVRAGAELLETNTFGGNPVKLSSHGLEKRTEELNREAAKLARQAAGERAFVGGAIGPLGVRIEPWGPTSREEAQEMYGRQVSGLLEGGVDGFILETFSDLDELEAACRAARGLSDLPVFAQMSFGADGLTSYGTPVEAFAERMSILGADALGINCAVGPAAMLETIERLAAVANRPIAALPNAGLPRSVGGRVMYLSSPEYMGRYAKRMIAAGVRFVGGCCGTTPDHIRQVRAEVGAVEWHPRARARHASKVAAAEGQEIRPLGERSALGAKIAAGSFLVTAEVVPPRGWVADEMLERAGHLRDAGVDAVHILDTPRAKSRMGVLPAALLIQHRVDVETIFHYTCRDRNMLGMQSDLLGAAAAGLRNVLVVTGDPPVTGAYPDSTAVFDIDSIGLTNLVHRLNQGLDPGGGSIGAPTSFVIAVALSHAAENLEEELHRFHWKVEAGADFAVTQPVFEPERLLETLERLERQDLRIPIVAGLWPLTSLRSAEYLAHEVPGVNVPEPVLDRMRRAEESGTEAAGEEGIAIALEILDAIRDSVEGVQVNAPREGLESMQRVIEAARRT